MSMNEIELESESGEMIRGSFQEPFQLNGDLLNPTLMIFCHGFPGSSMKGYDDLFAKLQNICAKLGLFSVRFDFRGCGSSDGSAENFTVSNALQDLEQINNWATEKKFERFMVTAEGLGCTVSMLGLEENMHAGAFFWPVLDTRDYVVRNFQADEHRERFQEGGYIQTKAGAVGLPLLKELYEMDLTSIMNRIKYPCLIQQGAKDEVIPIEHLDLACAHFRNRRIEITNYQDGTHGLLKENHRKYLMYHYEQFIQKYI